MSRVIHKIALEKQVTTITVPDGSFRVLEVHQQNDIPTIWFERAKDVYIKREVTFLMVPTGGEVPENFSHIGTVFLQNTSLVYHVYMND